MGVGMQIVYFGFPGAAQIEAEAGVQLLRLERFSQRICGCHLVIEALRVAGHPLYDARLDLITRGDKPVAIPHCSDEDPERAVRAAFDLAEQELDGGDGRVADSTS
jgi:hypothetical protein